MSKKDKDNSGVHTDPDALAKLDNLLAAPEFQGWEEENLSLPPYWVTDIGKQFAARVIDLDNGDPEFPRYVLEALAPVDCQSGKREEAEDVHVKIGEFFTCSTYAGLPLARYIGCRVVVKCTGTRKVNQPQPMYVFSMVMHRGQEDGHAGPQGARPAEAGCVPRVSEGRSRPPGARRVQRGERPVRGELQRLRGHYFHDHEEAHDSVRLGGERCGQGEVGASGADPY